MSKATELAQKFGHEFVSWLIAFYPAELEAFYHAARAEMANKLADWLDAQKIGTLQPTRTHTGDELAQSIRNTLQDCSNAFRAMADRDGK